MPEDPPAMPFTSPPAQKAVPAPVSTTQRARGSSRSFAKVCRSAGLRVSERAFRESGRPGEPARVHGYVAEGSIERDVAGRRVRFEVQNHPPHAGGDSGPRLAVGFSSLETPDLFKDGAEVVVEGRLAAADGTFHATNLLAKCPSKFEAEAQAASM